jgi:hypothetical protein
MVTATQCPSSCWPASAVSDNVRGVLQRHIGDAITQVIPARYGIPDYPHIAGSRTVCKGTDSDVLIGLGWPLAPLDVAGWAGPEATMPSASIEGTER